MLDSWAQPVPIPQLNGDLRGEAPWRRNVRCRPQLLGVKTADVVVTVQDRAYTSPIWYTP